VLALFAHSQDSINQLKDIAAYRHLKNYPFKTISDSDAGNALKGRIYDITNLVPRRKWIVGAGTALAYGSSFLLLNQAWYKDYPRSSFHSFNDAGEWMQMDKVGHAWTAYTTGKATTALWKWAGSNERSSVLFGAGSSLLYMLSIEYLDGRSAEWGWSWADVAADFSGTILFAAQEFGWKQQKIEMKFSSHKKNYEPSLNARADNLFGSGLPERLLKDYNAQTYWLSFNIRPIVKTENFPKWLNVSIGYGANGMFGGYQNIAYDKNGDIIFDRRDIKRYRQWYLAPDIDLTKIKTGSRFLRTLLFAANVLKFPSPVLEFSCNKFRLHLLTF
jgi:uncharacterized protein YfiM (DUF2279 family)